MATSSTWVHSHKVRQSSHFPVITGESAWFSEISFRQKQNVNLHPIKTLDSSRSCYICSYVCVALLFYVVWAICDHLKDESASHEENCLVDNFHSGAQRDKGIDEERWAA